MDEVLEKISQADSEELGKILQAVRVRYKILFPNWETVYIALPKDNLNVREKLLELTFDDLRKHRDSV